MDNSMNFTIHQSSWNSIPSCFFLRSPGGRRSPPEVYIYSGPKRPDKVTHLFTTAHAQAGVKSASNQRRATKGEKRREESREKRRRARTTTALPQSPRHMNSLTMPPGR